MPLTFFEGTEKKVEIAVSEGHPPLRGLGEAWWREVVEAAGAQILSKLSNEHLDAYLLSESSLIVHDEWATLITCGRTELVDAVEVMLRTISPEDVALLIYERKNHHFPERQSTNFFDDSRHLARLLSGRACRFGDEHDHHVDMFATGREHHPDPHDITVEVLMHGIDRELADSFHLPAAPEGTTVAVAVGADRILEGFTLDENIFTPAGYSLNGLSGEEYFTLHVTPEELGSYVSFETNHDFREDLEAVVMRVVNIFRPRSFDVVTFTADDDERELSPPGYLVKDSVESELAGYRVRFVHFYRPEAGRRPAVEIEL